MFPCLFHKNSNITLNLNFTTKAEYGSLTNQLFGTIAGVKVPFPLPDNEKSACSNGIKCPLVANQNFYQIISIPILSSYPDVRFSHKEFLLLSTIRLNFLIIILL